MNKLSDILTQSFREECETFQFADCRLKFDIVNNDANTHYVFATSPSSCLLPCIT